MSENSKIVVGLEAPTEDSQTSEKNWDMLELIISDQSHPSAMDE